MNPYALELRNITQQFPGVVANDDVSLQVQAGSIHALVGENGAGKSTLMRIAYGMQRPDTGHVLVFGKMLGRGGSARAIGLGVGMVHQHFMLVPTLSVTENIVLGAEPRRGLAFDRAEARRRVLETAERFGLAIDADARVEHLSVGEQQRVEILKVLVRGARVLILDEPTAVLTPQEVEELFTILRRWTDADHAVVLISHRLQEVLAHSDRITVMRDGRVVGEIETREADHESLARLVVGRPVKTVAHARDAAPPGETLLLRCQDLSTDEMREPLRGVSFELAGGEVLGIAGVEGNGQETLARVLLGLRALRAGSVLLRGVDITRASTTARREHGLAYVPADRMRDALIAEMRVDENALLGRQALPELGRGPWLSPSRIRAVCERLLEAFDVRPRRADLPAAVLSGGNQQRLVVGREYERDPDVLVLAQPTRGVDVGGIEFLHRRILAARQRGCGVLLLSADLGEILALSDRIAVMYQGRIAGTATATNANVAQLGLWMTGSGKDVA